MRTGPEHVGFELLRITHSKTANTGSLCLEEFLL